jgi:DNA processing protein
MSAELSPRTRAIVALRLVPGIGPRTLASLLEHVPDPAALLDGDTAALDGIPNLTKALLDKIAQAARSSALESELALLARHQVRPLTLGEPGFPGALTGLEGMPPLLYLAGEYLPADRRAVALVGSREPTPYGRRVAQRLARELAQAGITVVSGLARGIDGVAHEAALEAGGRTLAVLANGLSGIYPPEHADLAGRMRGAGGLFSEHPMGQKPQPGLFPSRNRLISGLSLAVVIVEAQAKSGTLHTATHAAEQGKPLLAVPGPIDSPLSEGCHTLLREGALVCRGIDDVLEAIGQQPVPDPTPVKATAEPRRAKSKEAPEPPAIPAAPVHPGPRPQPPGLSGQGLELWKLLENGPMHLEVLADRLGLNPGTLAQVLFPLELGQVVRRLPGGKLERGGRG